MKTIFLLQFFEGGDLNIQLSWSLKDVLPVAVMWWSSHKFIKAEDRTSSETISKILVYATWKNLETLKIEWKGNKFEQAIIRKTEHSLIHNRIKYTNIKINHLTTEIANTKTSLQQKLDEPISTNLQNINFSIKEKTFWQYKNNQIRKLKPFASRASTTTCKMASKTTNTYRTNATSSTTSSIEEKWVINLSKMELTPEKSLYYRKAWNLRLSQQPSLLEKYISTTTVAVLQAGEFNSGDCSGLYHNINRICNTYTNKQKHTNITKAEYIALENLGKDKDCIIVTADKGVTLVAMDITEYLTKCEALQEDNSVHQHLS